MTTPTNAPSTYRAALAAAEQLVAASRVAVDPTALSSSMSEKVIAVRESTAEWAKTAIERLWLAVDPYDPKQVKEFTVQAARLMEAGQTAVARTTAAAQAAQLKSMGIVSKAVPSNPLNVRGAGAVVREDRVIVVQHAVTVDYQGPTDAVKVARTDMSTQGIFNRPGMAFRYGKSTGQTDEAAAKAAVDRIGDLVENNLMLAQRIAEQDVLVQAVNLDTDRARGGTLVIGYRRIIHPELSRTGVCGMCIAASDRIYKIGTLKPIHDKCKCTIAAVTEDYDPADDLNSIDLSQLYKEAGGTSGAHLKRTRYKVDEHGELGPVLVPNSKYKPRTTKSKVRVGGTALQTDQPAQAEVARHQLKVMEDNLARLRDEGRAEDSAPVEYHKKLISKLRKQASDSPNTDPGGGGGDGGDGGGNPPGGSMDDWDDDRIPHDIRVHILVGDTRGGGHRHDSTAPKKTLFPASWSDAKCLAAVSAALDDSYLTSDDVDGLRSDIFLNRYVLVDGVRVVARIVKETGKLDTAYPLDGEGVYRTGKKDGTSKKLVPLGAVRGVPLPS